MFDCDGGIPPSDSIPELLDIDKAIKNQPCEQEVRMDVTKSILPEIDDSEDVSNTNNKQNIASDLVLNSEKSLKTNEKHPEDKTRGLSNRALKRHRRMQNSKERNRKNKVRTVEDRGYSTNIFSQTEYYFENGLRKVYPYNFTFSTHAKERWYKKTILDVFTKEFVAGTPEFYRRHIELGKVEVNGKRVTENYIIKNGDEISHTIHRHENPVLGGNIEIISDTDDLLVINKPASIPCHPCGKYRFNSIVFILGKELGYSNLRNIYRLDRLTSGVLILGKTVARTKQLEDHIVKRLVQKEYVCRVVGKFPDGLIKVDQPLACMRHNLTLWRVQEGGKESQTSFERLSYNGYTSVVRCLPHTGRTHQIRVHLQYLGHPIVNDPFYNSEAWGPNRGKGGIIENTEKEVADAILKEHNVGQWVEGENPLYTKKLKEMKAKESTKHTEESISESQEKKGDDDTSEPVTESSDANKNLMSDDGTSITFTTVKESDTLTTSDTNKTLIDESGEPPNKRVKLTNPEQLDFSEEKWNVDPDCEECKLKYLNPSPADLILYLHAYKYKGPDWEYEASLPDWASEDWKDIND
ncbi:uncharacterized protein LOC126810023 [Patella vulgata]|uniref:uncharacterized protein LOC126810023 n=1 Tax=Patella vulgata TaxID=6465 RepID=UPI0021805046|nr:uncharacterized protein LOC126810023 [Patella vulgata]